MGLESVEIILGWESAFGINFGNDELINIGTPKMAIDLISIKVEASNNFAGVCLGLRAYHRIRQAFCNVVETSRKQIRLDSKLRELMPKKRRSEVWKEICSDAGLVGVPPFGFGVGVIFVPITVRDLVDWAVAHCPSNLIGTDERWTQLQVRSVVRAVIRDVVGIEEFNDDDDFVRDIGIG